MKMRVTTKKNKTSSPNKKCELTVYYDTGLDTTGGVIDLLCEKDLISKGGGGNFSFTVEDELIKIRGKLNLIEYFQENDDIFTQFKIDAGLELPQEEVIAE